MIIIRAPSSKAWRNRETYSIIERSLRKKWKTRVVRASNERDLFGQLGKRGGDQDQQFVFNIAEYLDEKRKRWFLPGLLESWGCPHLGSPASTVIAGLDKERTKEILRRAGVPTPRSFVTEPGDPNMHEKAARIGFPLFVKPLREGGHLGVSRDSVVRGIPALDFAVMRVVLGFHQPALVEEFVGGKGMREFSVGIVGSTNRYSFPIEIDWDEIASEERILSADISQSDREKVKLVTDSDTRGILRELADRTFDALDAKDYARIDIRADDRNMYVLEINIMPGIGPRSFLPRAAYQMLGIDHEDLIRTIAAKSMARQGIVEKLA